MSKQFLIKHITIKASILFCCAFFLTGCSTTVAPIVEPEAVETVNEPMQVVTSTFFLPILALHHVGPAPSSISNSAATWYISSAKLESILVEAEAREYTTLTISEVVEHLDRGVLPEKPLVLTFDDGWSDVAANAYPLLQQYDAKASVFIMTGVSRGVLTDEEMLTMRDSGLVDIQSHTRYHQYLTRVSAAEQQAELTSSFDAITDLIGTSPVAIAYPYGLHNAAVEERAANIGYRVGLTIEPGVWQEKFMTLHRNIVTESTNIESLFDSWEESRRSP